MSASETHTCAVCAKPTTLRCSKCKAVYYCSKEHNKSDWPSHKWTCPKPATTVTAVLFPVKGGNPRLVEVGYETYIDNEYGFNQHRLLLDPWIPHQTGYPIDRHGYEGPLLGRTLMLFYNDMFLRDGTPLNRCIARLVPNGHNWGGDILVLRAREPLSVYARYYNATLDDIEPALENFRGYGAALRAERGY